MKRFDPKNRHTYSYVFFGDDSFLSVTSGKPWLNGFFVMLCSAFLVASWVLITAKEAGLVENVIGIIFSVLAIISIGTRKKLYISDGIIELTYFFDLCGVKRIFKVRKYNLSDFDRSFVLWNEGNGSNSRHIRNSAANLYIKNDIKVIRILNFSLRGDGHALFIDFVKRIELIIGLKVKIKNQHHYLDISRDE